MIDYDDDDDDDDHYQIIMLSCHCQILSDSDGPLPMLRIHRLSEAAQLRLRLADGGGHADPDELGPRGVSHGWLGARAFEVLPVELPPHSSLQ